MNNDPLQSKTVCARLPIEEIQYAKYVVNGHTSRKIVDSRRLAALGEYIGLIFYGGVLESPLAVFQGIRRPYIKEGLDDFIFVYVSKPALTFYYAPRDQFDGTGPHETKAPKDSVFTIFVSMARDMVDASTSGSSVPSDDVRGVILAWEWTLASPTDPRVPAFHQTRYRRAIWLPK